MRILSQGNGKYDLQYENVVLEKMTDSNSIYAYTGTGQPFKVAQYSSVAKADKAMEMLKIAYAGKFITNADILDDFDGQLKELMKHGFGAVTIREFDDCKVEFNNLNGYFQFPSDEEVEG